MIQVCPWHPPQALTSEYPTVLHLHKLESSTPLGPEYDCPGCSGAIVYAERDKTIRLADAGQNKQVSDSLLPLHVPNMVAATLHGSWLRELNDWMKRPSGQEMAKERIAEMTTSIPMPMSSYNLEQRCGLPQSQKRRLRMRVV